MKQILGETARLRVKDRWRDSGRPMERHPGPRASFLDWEVSRPRSRGFLELLTWPELDWWMSSTQVGIGRVEVLRLHMEESVFRTQNLALVMGNPGVDWPQMPPQSRDLLYLPPPLGF